MATTIQVTGQCLSPQGAPAEAELQFFPSNIAGTPSGTMYMPSSVIAVTDSNGNWSATLLATDTGAAFVWYLTIEMSFAGGPGRPGAPIQQFVFQLPSALAPGPVPLLSLALLSQPSPTSPGGAPVIWQSASSGLTPNVKAFAVAMAVAL